MILKTTGVLSNFCLCESHYFCFVNDLIYKEIHNLTPAGLHITFFDSFYPNDVIKFEDVFLNNKGVINHLDKIGNEIIYKKVLHYLL